MVDVIHRVVFFLFLLCFCSIVDPLLPCEMSEMFCYFVVITNTTDNLVSRSSLLTVQYSGKFAARFLSSILQCFCTFTNIILYLVFLEAVTVESENRNTEFKDEESGVSVFITDTAVQQGHGIEPTTQNR